MVLTKYEVFSDKVSRDYTFVMLSDLHNRDFTEAVRITRDQSPDMIFVVGDLVDRHKKHMIRRCPFFGSVCLLRRRSSLTETTR